MLKRFYKDQIYTNRLLRDDGWLSDFAYLVDVTNYLKELNLNMQKPGQLTHELFTYEKSFQIKIILARNTSLGEL